MLLNASAILTNGFHESEDLGWDKFLVSIGDTFIMLGISLPLIILLGLIIGMIMYVTSSYYQKQSKITKAINQVLMVVVSMLRSIPFIILILAIIPITMALMGTFLGWEGAIPALVISATPFYAQIVFNSVTQVSPDIVETAKAMGASPLRIVWIVIHEALSPLIRGITITFISLIGLIAITGVVGAGGIGQYCQNATKTLGEDDDWLWLGVATILVIILVVQVVGEIFARKLDHH